MGTREDIVFELILRTKETVGPANDGDLRLDIFQTAYAVEVIAVAGLDQ